MSYCTEAQLLDRFGHAELITVADAGNDVLDSALIAKALADAHQQIDNRLATRYAVPVPVDSGPLEMWAGDLARYRLYDDNPLDEVRKRYEQAIKELTEYANGKAVLIGAELATDGPRTFQYQATRSNADRVFTRDTLDSF